MHSVLPARETPSASEPRKNAGTSAAAGPLGNGSSPLPSNAHRHTLSKYGAAAARTIRSSSCTVAAVHAGAIATVVPYSTATSPPSLGKCAHVTAPSASPRRAPSMVHSHTLLNVRNASMMGRICTTTVVKSSGSWGARASLAWRQCVTHSNTSVRNVFTSAANARKGPSLTPCAVGNRCTCATSASSRRKCRPQSTAGVSAEYTDSGTAAKFTGTPTTQCNSRHVGDARFDGDATRGGDGPGLPPAGVVMAAGGGGSSTP